MRASTIAQQSSADPSQLQPTGARATPPSTKTPARPLDPALKLFQRAGVVLSALSCAWAADPQGVSVSGLPIEINGKSEIPRGLFGVHAMDLDAATAAEWGIEAVRRIYQNPDGKPGRIKGATGPASSDEPLVVDCYFDRYQPALQLNDPAWKERLESLAKAYGENAAITGRPAFMEFWNEPYLNWATKPGVNYAPTLYRTEGVQAGDPMVLKTTGEPVEGLVWDREIFFVKDAHGGLNFVLSSYIPRDGREGETVTLGYGAGPGTLIDGGTVRLRGADHTLTKQWSGKDPGQKFYWSGPVNERLYNEMFGVFAAKLKATNPDVPIAAGWGFNFFNEGWEVWHRLIKPTIDKNHAWMDALHEHHYGGDSRKVAASYEVAYAYALGNYGKRLDFWNTEAGGHLDPQQPGNAKSANEGDPRTRATAAMTYMLRDIAYLLDRMPDKAIHRAAHEPQNNGGDRAAFELLKPLRGQLLETHSSMPGIWASAAIREKTMTVFVFNDANSRRDVPVRLQAPPGTRFVSGKERRVTDGVGEDGMPLEVSIVELAISGETWSASLPMEAKSAVVLEVALDGIPAFESIRRWRQDVSPEVLIPVRDGKLTATIPLPPEALLNNSGAKLRLVADNIGDKPTVLFNGETLPAASSTLPVWDIPIPPEMLAAENQITLLASQPNATLLSASIYTETTQPANSGNN